MDLNGNLTVLGGGIPVLRGVGPATEPGEDGMCTKGVLLFPNGFKIQWDTVSAPARAAASFNLPEAYTEDHYTVFGTYAVALDVAALTSSFAVFVQSNTQVRMYSNYLTLARAISYVSFGKDTV
jgi:hypothetical protein